MRIQPLTLAILLAAAPAASAGSEEADFFSLERASLEELLDIRTSVATRSEMTLREAPGLVTVITREEIQASGARDLIDVLQLVPEFSFGVDVQGNPGLGVRGAWANEGKALLLWDGQVYNEPLYSTIQFDRFPVDQVEEIEIIRGPGSAVYGGHAETAVINIRTRSARALRGAEAYAAAGLGGGERRYAGLSYGAAGPRGELEAKTFWGESQRSYRRYADSSGASYGMGGNSALRPRSLNLRASSGSTTARLLLDAFSLRERDQFSTLLSTGDTRVDFKTFFAELSQSVRLSNGLRLEPRFNYAQSRPWHEDDEHFPYDKRVTRFTAGLTAAYRASSDADFLAGGEYYHEDADIGSATSDASAAYGGVRRDHAHYDNHALYAQAALGLPFARVTAGGRYERHSQYGSALVPRVALTRVLDPLHFKAIFSQAFRAPAMENIRLNPGIDPERTTSLELESGYRYSDSLFLSANAFHVSIKDPIVFTVVNNAETYSNYGRTGVKGLGGALKYKTNGLRADLGYLYQEAQCNRVGLYAVPGHSSRMLAFPRHKLTLNSSVPLAAGLSLNPSAVYTAKRYGYGSAGALKVFGERTVANLNLQARDRLLPGLTLNLGVRDLFNSNFSYIQPYDGGHAPLPAPGRELVLKAAYEF